MIQEYSPEVDVAIDFHGPKGYHSGHNIHISKLPELIARQTLIGACYCHITQEVIRTYDVPRIGSIEVIENKIDRELTHEDMCRLSALYFRTIRKVVKA